MTTSMFTNVLKLNLVLFVNQWPLRVAILTPMQVCFVNFIFLSVFYWSCVTERLVYVFINKLGVRGGNSLLNHVLISWICVLFYFGVGWLSCLFFKYTGLAETLNVVSHAPASVPAHVCIPKLFNRGGANSSLTDQFLLSRFCLVKE